MTRRRRGLAPAVAGWSSLRRLSTGRAPGQSTSTMRGTEKGTEDAEIRGRVGSAPVSDEQFA